MKFPGPYIGDLPESLSQARLVGIMLVGRLGVCDLWCNTRYPRHTTYCMMLPTSCTTAPLVFAILYNLYSLPQIRRQRELPRTSEVCPYIVKDLIIRPSEVFFLGVRAIFGVVIYSPWPGNRSAEVRHGQSPL